jgi:hypothetical protein
MFEKILAYMDDLATQIEVAFAKYFPLYIDWVTQKLEGTEPMAVLAMSVAAIFALAIYVWFRNR